MQAKLDDIHLCVAKGETSKFQQSNVLQNSSEVNLKSKNCRFESLSVSDEGHSPNYWPKFYLRPTNTVYWCIQILDSNLGVQKTFCHLLKPQPKSILRLFSVELTSQPNTVASTSLKIYWWQIEQIFRSTSKLWSFREKFLTDFDILKGFIDNLRKIFGQSCVLRASWGPPKAVKICIKSKASLKDSFLHKKTSKIFVFSSSKPLGEPLCGKVILRVKSWVWNVLYKHLRWNGGPIYMCIQRNLLKNWFIGRKEVKARTQRWFFRFIQITAMGLTLIYHFIVFFGNFRMIFKLKIDFTDRKWQDQQPFVYFRVFWSPQCDGRPL